MVEESMRALARVLTALFALSVVSTQAQAQAQIWPQRTVRVILPIGPGSATDLTARLFAERLAARWGQPVVVENRPGADGIPAVTSFISARDEHTLFFSFGGPVTTNLVTREKLPYEVADLVPIASASESFLAIAAHNEIASLDDLVKRARAAPGKINWAATPGLPHFIFAGFLKSIGLEMAHIAYRDFAPAQQDVAEGRIQVISASLQLALGPARSGKAKLLAITTAERSPLVPEVTTAKEAGYPDLLIDSFQGFFGWRGMPDALRDRIAADVMAVGRDPEIAQRLIPIGQMLKLGDAAALAAMVASQRQKVTAIAKAIDLKPTQ
jgi:tripartite-type tricarboxylate transporter receptor subunit TctC